MIGRVAGSSTRGVGGLSDGKLHEKAHEKKLWLIRKHLFFVVKAIIIYMMK